ncbi:MAG: hypothetical protein ACPG4Z_00325 [Chitinophagales bacterium]
MKKLLILPLLFCLAAACGKPCLECNYSTSKGSIQEKYCSTTKSDRDAFEARWDSIAKANGSFGVCEKARY